jgi:hypothetical protein
MESFNTNIVYFDGINQCQWYFFFSTVRIQWPLSLFPFNQGQKKKQKKLLYQN